MRQVTVEDVMTRLVVTAAEETPYKELARLMAEHGVSGLPVVDGEQHLVGIVTEGDLLLAEDGPMHPNMVARLLLDPKRVAALRVAAQGIQALDVMTRDVVTVAPGDDVHTATRILLRSGVRRMPVIDEDRRVIGIVSRRDLLRPYLRTDAEIEAELREDILGRILEIDPRSVAVEVESGVVHLAGEVETEGLKRILLELAARVHGVVGVDDHLSYRRARPATHGRPPVAWPAART